MKFLFDTNIVIPLESDPVDVATAKPDRAAELMRLLAGADHSVFIHPAIHRDIERDSDAERQRLRRFQISKYRELDRPPQPSLRVESVFDRPSQGSNDWVDQQLLAALESDAIDILVTEDARLRARAERLGLSGRIAGIDDAIALVESLFTQLPTPPPAVDLIPAYALDTGDPIFDGLRSDYPGFDGWLRRVKREHRPAYVIRNDGGGLAGIALLKLEDSREYGLSPNALKVSTLKISGDSYGRRYGELLLKPIFKYARENNVEQIYVTVFKKHAQLVELLETFGFSPIENETSLGELVLVKEQQPSEVDRQATDALAFSRRFGPDLHRLVDEDVLLVPIRPVYHRILFPDAELQQSMLPGIAPPGNAIRKAYISNSPIRNISQGSLMLFYRTAEDQTGFSLPAQVLCTGVLERFMVSKDPNAVAAAVSKRTVYSFREIQQMCRRPTLTLIFRHCTIQTQPISLDELIVNTSLEGPPQSIVKLAPENMPWIRMRLTS